jgi:hypothetical protein
MHWNDMCFGGERIRPLTQSCQETFGAYCYHSFGVMKIGTGVSDTPGEYYYHSFNAVILDQPCCLQVTSNLMERESRKRDNFLEQ